MTTSLEKHKIEHIKLSNNSHIVHSNTLELSSDDHSIYALLAGRSGGQTLKGGTGSGDDLTLQSTSHATKGSILFGTSAYDEVNNRLGIGTSSPNTALEVQGLELRIQNGSGNCKIEVGQGGSGNRNAYIDFVGDDTYADYGMRVGRDSGGPDGISQINHRGTGPLRLYGIDAGSFEVWTNNTQRLVIDTSGNVGIGKTPSFPLDIDLSTADLGISDATNTGTAGTYTEDGYITVDIGGSTRYIRVYDLT